MNNPKTLSWIAIVISIVALVSCLMCCGKCDKKRMHRRGDHGRPEMMMKGHGPAHHGEQPAHQPSAEVE